MRPSVAGPKELRERPEGYRALLRQMIESQAYREISAANLFGHSLKFVDDLALKREIVHDLEEEIEHYQATVSLYRDAGFGDVAEAIRDRLGRVPYPESWLELSVAQFLYDRAGKFHLREYRECSYLPYAKAVTRILEEEEQHEDFGAKFLQRFCADPSGRPKAQALFDRWLGVALLSFGRPGTAGNAAAIESGLKGRDSGEVMKEFLEDIKPTMRACGLAFPPREAVGVELPPDVAWRL
ncbi:MAG: Phenylacetic acid catabolic protein [Planctomycetota bacterium]